MEPYVSCIKIQGTPILPPLLTDERRIEMNNYKKLALAVEDKLTKLRTVNSINANKKVDPKGLSPINDEVSNVESVVQHINTNIAIQRVTTDEVPQNNTRDCQSASERFRGTSDDNTITINADIDKFMNISDSSKTNITETASEIVKPNVPKTLNIVPITVEPTKAPIHLKASCETKKSEEKVAKLVRQGSYTLDSPSPMLLAHLEISEMNYVPTCISNDMKKRIWSSIDNKVEWKYQRTASDFKTCQYLNGNKIHSDGRRNSMSVCESNIRENKSIGNKKERECIIAKRRLIRSMDSIPMMFTKEYNDSPNNNKRNCTTEICSSNGECNSSNNQIFAMNENIVNRNVINKFGGSLGALTHKSSTVKKKLNQMNNNRLTKSFDTSSTVKHELGHSPEKSRPIIVSEKLIHVFKEIQKTHERQMADLIARQQKEQITIQQEFQKQQLILLSKIEQSFPGIALPLLANKITSTINSMIQEQKYSSYDSISLPKSMGGHTDSQNSTKDSDYTQNRSDLETSLINGSSFESDESIFSNFIPSTRERSSSNSNVNQERRISNVSRRLFPLTIKPSQKPLTNGLIYNERHIQAATIVNAYVRGYLVRRLMKTERMITLRNTYREALHCILKLYVDAPLPLPEWNFLKRLQDQCDAASISIVELFAQSPRKQMELIAQDRQLKKIRQERPNSARSAYSFATQRTLARKKFKEMGNGQATDSSRSTSSTRIRCQTWTSNSKEKRSPGITYKGLKRSTSAGTVRKPWR